MSTVAFKAARKLVPKGGSGGNMALAFGALVAGGVVLDYGLKAFGSATAAAAAGGGSSASGGGGGGSAAGSGPATGTSASGGPTVIADSGYTNPLQHVTHWERTDQGVDATLPVGAPIVAPGRIKIIGIEPAWTPYGRPGGQPFVWWQLLDGPDKGQYQYVAEQITDIAPVGKVLNAGDPIATYYTEGTGIEYGWATASGQTLAIGGTDQGVGGKSGVYTEGYSTVAGNNMRKWLNSLGAGAGSGAGLSIGAGADPDDAAAGLLNEQQSWLRRITKPGYTYLQPDTVPYTPSKSDDSDDDDDDTGSHAADYDGDT